MNNQPFVLDKENLVRTGNIPVIAAAVLGATWLLRIYLGYLYSPFLTFLQVFAGGVYMKSILDSGEKPALINAGLNGAVSGAVTITVYILVSWMAQGISNGIYSLDVLSLIINALEGAFLGFLGALSWFAYKTNINI